MMPFSTGIGLDRGGNARQELELPLGRSAGSGRWTSLQRTRNKEDRRGLPVVTLMPKLVLSCGEKRSTVSRANVLRTFHRWGGLIFIAYVFPNWMVVRILSHWMGDFLPLSLSD